MGNGLLKLFRIGGVYLRPEVILRYCNITNTQTAGPNFFTKVYLVRFS